MLSIKDITEALKSMTESFCCIPKNTVYHLDESNSVLQIRGGIEDNSEIILFISQ